MKRTLTFISVFALMISMLALPAAAQADPCQLSDGYDAKHDVSPDDSTGTVDIFYEGVKVGEISYNDPLGTVSISLDAGYTIDLCVFGGTERQTYTDVGDGFVSDLLQTPSNQIAGVSNFAWKVSPPPFVPEGAVTVKKTAVPSFTRTHEWDIDKSVETDKGLELEDGTPKIWLYTDGDGDETATWTVDVSYEDFEDSAWRLDGKITATNTGNVGAQIRNWTDSQVKTGNVSIRNCRNDATDESIGSVFNYVIPVGESVTCDYLVDPADPTVTSNTATVGGWFVLDGPVGSLADAVGRFSEQDTATYAWDMPTNEVNKTVNVEDISDLFGKKDLGSVTEPNGDTFTYDKAFAWEDFGRDGCGSFKYDNTATIVETEQSASATLKVNVQCFVGETAWAADADEPGEFRYTQRGNWATYIDARDLPKEGSIFAGQTILVGSYVLSTDDVLDITLNEPWVLEPGEESVKIQGYDEAPSGNPAPGRFTTYKGSELTSIQLDGSSFYGIHLNVEQPDPNFGP